jgi:hypothetical protein
MAGREVYLQDDVCDALPHLHSRTSTLDCFDDCIAENSELSYLISYVFSFSHRGVMKQGGLVPGVEKFN